MTAAERVAHELRRLVESQPPGGIFVVVRTVTEAKAQFSALVNRAAGGEEVIISKAGQAVAVLVPYTHATGVRRPGRLRGRIRIAEDFDTLPQDIADAFGAGDP